MAKRVKNRKSKSGIRKLEKEVRKFDNEINVIGNNIEKEAKEVETWMVQRKKFLIKLAWVSGFIAVLLIVSHLYLRTRGLG